MRESDEYPFRIASESVRQTANTEPDNRSLSAFPTSRYRRDVWNTGSVNQLLQKRLKLYDRLSFVHVLALMRGKMRLVF